MRGLRDRWVNLPRAVRWTMLFGLFVVFYFGVVEPVVDRYNDFKNAANKSEASLAMFASAGDSLKNAAVRVAVGTQNFGTVEFPGDPDQRSVAFNQAVDAILAKHNVRATSTTRPAAMGSGPLLGKLGADYRVDKLTKMIEFRAEPEQVSAVLADLEKSPLVTTISLVFIRRTDVRDQGSRELSATITAETWLLAKKGARPR